MQGPESMLLSCGQEENSLALHADNTQYPVKLLQLQLCAVKSGQLLPLPVVDVDGGEQKLSHKDVLS